GLSEEKLLIEIDQPVPAAAVGRVLTIDHRNGSGSAWCIEAVEPAGDNTRLRLSRSPREGYGRLGKIEQAGRVFYANSGFPVVSPFDGFRDGMWISVKGERVLLETVQ